MKFIIHPHTNKNKKINKEEEKKKRDMVRSHQLFSKQLAL